MHKWLGKSSFKNIRVRLIYSEKHTKVCKVMLLSILPMVRNTMVTTLDDLLSMHFNESQINRTSRIWTRSRKQ
ncbi:hypothetical protein CDL12_11205 [Handroanthus impetiginosus]|uniref:Uncharacterized protein n=1 Tax=Handroanthus impetiginosus TaxID=429701 RepID=A0A2G9HF35_9LAMI|nr:hypothetical protein CDL12_11205 [Handroanthus impetiginosus]